MGITKEQLESMVVGADYKVHARQGTITCMLTTRSGYLVKGTTTYLGADPALMAMAQNGARLHAMCHLREFLAFHEAELIYLGSKV